MRHSIKIIIFCLLGLYFVACDKKSSKKEVTASAVVPVGPTNPQPGLNPKCRISVSYHPKKEYLTNLFRATSYDHAEMKQLGLKERLALLDLCKEELKRIKENSAG